MKKNKFIKIFSIIVSLVILLQTFNINVFSQVDDPIVYDITDYETIFEIGNIGAVDNSPTNETIFSFEKDVIIQSITTYHWNYAQGKEPGSISIATLDGTIVGTWEATTRPGMYEVPNAYWDVFPFIHLDAGIQYKIIDSDPSTWAHNYESNYTGFVDIRGLILDDPNPPIIYGDINGDNNIDNLDLVTLCQYLIKTSEFNEKQMQCADTSKDNQVDIADLALLKQHLMGDNILNQITYT